jgi:hypothetical protein
MKTKLLFTFLFISIITFGQILPNAGFENWTIIPYDNPSPWFNSNNQCLQTFSVANVTKVTGFSGFAVRMETKANATDTVFAYINHSPNDPTKDLGVPYSQQPTAINGYYRYNLPGNDTALILVTFKKNGAVLTNDLFKIRGTGSQPTFVPFTYTLSVASIPDTVIIASSCSNALGNVGIQNGSFMELDELSFSGPGVTQPIPGGDFETWTTSSLDFPISWYRWGEGFSRSTSSYSGLYAASMSVFDYGGGNLGPAGMTNGIPSSSTTLGGSPYSNLIDTLTFYYKYTSPGNDTAQAYVGLKKNFSYIYGASKMLTKTPTYTFAKIPLTPFTAPDTIVISFQASAGYTLWPAVANSNLWVDDIYYKSNLTGISESALINNETTVFPNPATTKLNIRISTGIVYENLEINIYDINGKKVLSETQINAHGVIPLNIETLSSGMYYYQLSGDNINLKNKFIKQ